jgi:hypothetical protein
MLELVRGEALCALDCAGVPEDLLSVRYFPCLRVVIPDLVRGWLSCRFFLGGGHANSLLSCVVASMITVCDFVDVYICVDQG